jgi:hypothetical protein
MKQSSSRRKFLSASGRLTFYLVSMLILISGCSVEKRTYRPGYYFSWNRSVSSEVTAEPKTATETSKAAVQAVAERTPAETIIAQTRVSIPDSCGDVITMRSGNAVKAKVMEVGTNEIRYKRCDNLSGPVYTVPKNEVASIEYSNGMKDAFEEKKNAADENTVHYTPATRDNAAAAKNGRISKTFGITSLVLTGIFLLCLGAGIGLLSGLTYLGFFFFMAAYLAYIPDIVFSILALAKSSVARRTNSSNNPVIEQQWKLGRIAGLIGLAVCGLALATLILLLFI